MTPAEFYAYALPQIERLCDLARTWRDAAPADPKAIQAHSEMTWMAIRMDLRLSRSRQRAGLRPERPGGAHAAALHRRAGVCQ